MFRKLFVGHQFSLVHSGTSLPIPMHAHSEYVVGYFIRGCARGCFRSIGSVEFRPGTLGLLNPGEAHEDYETPQEREYLTVNFREQFFREQAEDLGRSARPLTAFPIAKLECDTRLRRTFEALRYEVDSQEVGREIVLASLATQLGILLLRLFHSHGVASEKLAPYRLSAAWRVRKALEYLTEHCTEEFDLGRIAEASGLSKFHLDRVFKQSTGLSPHSYVTNLRLNRAKHLLTDTPKPIADIALEMGFSDQSHFTNVFKQFTGITPKAYRLGSAK